MEYICAHMECHYLAHVYYSVYKSAVMAKTEFKLKVLRSGKSEEEMKVGSYKFIYVCVWKRRLRLLKSRVSLSSAMSHLLCDSDSDCILCRTSLHMMMGQKAMG